MKFLKMERLKNMIQEDEALAEEVRRCECFFGKSCEAYKEKYRKEKTQRNLDATLKYTESKNKNCFKIQKMQN